MSLGTNVAAALLAAAAFALGCDRFTRDAPPSAASSAGSPGRAGEAGETFPLRFDRSKYVGSAACAPCHADQHAAWAASPHGRATLPGTPKAVLADFAAPALAVEGGAVRFRRVDDEFWMDVQTRAATTRHKVDAVIGSGRQHQVFLTRDEGTWRVLPAAWTTPEKRWIPMSLYQPMGDGWRERSLVDAGCANCHLSQGGYRIGGKGIEPIWVEMPVNCESCHGPGAEHVALRTAKIAGGGKLRDLKNVGQDEEGRVCGVCHADHFGFATEDDAHGWPWFAASTLRDGLLRPDGTQKLPSYQYSGHVASACYRGTGMLCSSCHAPHTALPRALDGTSAVGKDSDRQCTACHRKYLDEAWAKKHGRHAKQLRCIDCHMAMSWIGDSPERQHRTSDHSISTPRPKESLEAGTPNACTTCHTDKDPAWALGALGKWGAKEALGARPWVLAVQAGRKRSPGASDQLIRLLADPQNGPYLHASALDLLSIQPLEPKLAVYIERWTRDADPWIRTLAYRALVTHAPDRADWYCKRALDDPHPIVRLTMFPLLRDPAALTSRALDRQLADLQATAQRPEIGELLSLAEALAMRGEGRRARDVLAIVRRWGTAVELRHPRIEAVERLITNGPGRRP